jgi:hypothetical protein
VFVEVRNTGRAAHRVLLSIHTGSALLGEETLQVPAGDSQSRSYFLKPMASLAEDRLLATLTAPDAAGAADGFGLDDRAFALVPRQETRRVLLVTAGNLFLEKALSLNPAVQLEVIPPARFQPAALGDYQAAVFDGVCPASPVPAVYFDVTGEPGCPFELGDEVGGPRLQPLKGDHPVTEGITLVDFQIKKARHLVPRAGDLELLCDDKGPIVLAREAGPLRQLAFGFDLAQSDLPLRVAFPMLLQNSLTWFLGEILDMGFNDLAVGRPIELGSDAREGRILDPRGKVVAPTRLGDRLQLRPRWPGFYVRSAGALATIYPVNYQLASESDLAGDRQSGAGRLKWTGGDPPPELVAGFDQAEHADPPPLWPRILIVAIWLLLFDWVFFSFRILF